MPSPIRLVRSIRKKIEQSWPDLLIVTERRRNLPVARDDRRAVVSEEAKGRIRRRLAAILVTGLSPLFPGDEKGSLARLRSCLTEIIVPLISQFDGSIFKQTGDLVLS